MSLVKQGGYGRLSNRITWRAKEAGFDDVLQFLRSKADAVINHPAVVSARDTAKSIYDHPATQEFLAQPEIQGIRKSVTDHLDAQRKSFTQPVVDKVLETLGVKAPPTFYDKHVAPIVGKVQEYTNHPVGKAFMNSEEAKMIGKAMTDKRLEFTGPVIQKVLETVGLAPRPSFFQRHGGKILAGVGGLGALGLGYSLLHPSVDRLDDR